MKNLIDAAMHRVKADTVLKNATYVDVFTPSLRKGDIAVKDGKICGIGVYEGEVEIDASGMTVTPSLIDGHIHIESTQLSPEEFALHAVAHGTGTVIADPHEITNVCGIDGARYIARVSENLPLDVCVQLPSCVPATPFETSGCVITGKMTEEYCSEGFVHGLGEMMNYPGVINADAETLTKLQAAQKAGLVIDGHAPSVYGDALNAYLCTGIRTDHECGSTDEVNEKIAKGMYVHLRYGSSTKNLAYNLPCVNLGNLRRFLLCTDDKHAADLIKNGHLDDALRVCVRCGLDPVYAVVIATLNAAECYRLSQKGAIAPSYAADLTVWDNLTDFNARYVFKDGKLVAKDGKALFSVQEKYLPDCVKNTVRLKRPLQAEDFCLKMRTERARVIEVISDTVLTKCVVLPVENTDGNVRLGDGLLKLAVVERHHQTGNIGLGLVTGYGLTGGAIGITVAHDSHNLIILGDNDADMAAVGNHLAKIGGGMAVSANGRVESVALDIAGLMSSKAADEHASESARLMQRAYALGVDTRYDAFLTLAFLSLAVIPELKLTDLGLFDVTAFDFTDLNV